MTGSEIQHLWYLCVSSVVCKMGWLKGHMSPFKLAYKHINHHRVRAEQATDQGLTRVRPVEFDAHIELGVGSAAENQPLAHRQPHLHKVQGEVIDFVSCGKGREDSSQSTAYCCPETTDSLSLCTYSPSLAQYFTESLFHLFSVSLSLFFTHTSNILH